MTIARFIHRHSHGLIGLSLLAVTVMYPVAVVSAQACQDSKTEGRCSSSGTGTATGGTSGSCGTKPGSGGANNSAANTQNKPVAQYCLPFTDNTQAVKTSHQGQDFVNAYITPAIQAASALTGIAIAASLAVAGIQYSTAGGDSGKVSAAKMRILKTLFALAAFVFFYAFMHFILLDGVAG